MAANQSIEGGVDAIHLIAFLPLFLLFTEGQAFSKDLRDPK